MGTSVRGIAEKLAIPKSTVSDTIRRWRATGDVAPAPGSTLRNIRSRCSAFPPPPPPQMPEKEKTPEKRMDAR
ncbi:hypothetical protein RUND412_003493 [Rhizina undulata]